MDTPAETPLPQVGQSDYALGATAALRIMIQCAISVGGASRISRGSFLDVCRSTGRHGSNDGLDTLPVALKCQNSRSTCWPRVHRDSPQKFTGRLSLIEGEESIERHHRRDVGRL